MLYPASFGDNPLYPKDTDFRVIRKDDTNGFGVISLRSFKRGEIVAAMAGEVVTDIRQHTLQIDDESHLHDTHFSGYFLHSCSPNISLDMRNMLITAVEDIPANSYLYMDYAET
ncbi:MAG TPA: SET domain-containing protein-lysine N-methyltransferase, partial [Gammaproteobacteria bacterium]|nr:SET domain-containing protein-lysine N-methyltransferase [Gammaproteobacteria bacterium]